MDERELRSEIGNKRGLPAQIGLKCHCILITTLLAVVTTKKTAILKQRVFQIDA
jgi:hypothetical protein